MKKLDKLLIAVFITLSHNIIGQDFSFKLVFCDAIGNTDTLIIGYDATATDSVDINFNEENIISKSLDSVFDVRITDEWTSRMQMNAANGNYHLKKQIIKTNCDTWPTAICIDIKCKNWPVTVSWDNTLFNNDCTNGSVLTSIPPGGWWDVGSPSNLMRAELMNKNQVTFSANYVDNVNEYYAYLNRNRDTISVFWVAMAETSILNVGIDNRNQENDVILFPNPSSDIIQITGHLANQIKQVLIHDISGKNLPIVNQTQTIDLRNLPQGIYVITLTLKNDASITRRIVKH